jgi:methylenetetrahydrofolate dehydrogenase (NADP+) / methenyltetrahydrofolate cyclohydrolase
VSCRWLEGKALAQEIRGQVADEVVELRAVHHKVPGLTVVLVGDDSASRVYVRNKTKACDDAGITSNVIRLPATTTQAELLDLLDTLNADPAVHGILVQLPLPPQILDSAVIARIDPRKDVDGFHPENAGLLAIGSPRFVPCTPLGIRALLIHAGVETSGARAVVLGRSQIVGKSMALLLLQKGQGGDATVTVCHSATRDTAAVAREADILIAAIGRPQLVRGDWIKPGAVVIDVGIHRLEDGSLCGDVHHGEAAAVASLLTPVPGGVGPLTVAMLLRNTLDAFKLSLI